MTIDIVVRFCFLLVACSVIEVYKSLLVFLLGLLIMDCASYLKSLSHNSDFEGGFLVFGCFPQIFNFFGLFFIVYTALKFMQFGFRGRDLVQFLCGNREKSSDLRNGLCSKIGFGEDCDAKILSCDCGGPWKFLENSKLQKVKSKNITADDDDERECCDEDREFDVMVLRRLVKIERQRANVTLRELEKERMAASSAADEAMAMILRLQNEKSSIEIEAKQYRIMAEQKQDYDKEMIQLLQWIVMKHESERCQLEQKLKLCRKKLNQYVKDFDDDDDDGGDIQPFEAFVI